MGRIADDELAHMPAGIGDDLDAVLVFNLVRTQGRLSPFIDAGLREENLTAAQFNALLILRAAGADGLLMGEVGQRLVVTKSNVTGLVGRLERQGLVARGDHRDGRAKVVRLTREGTRLIGRALPRYARLVAEFAGGLDDREKRILVGLLTKLRRELRRRQRQRA